MSDAYSGTPSADSYYERLGVDRAASDDDIDTASKLAKRAVHPDNNSSEQATAEREFDRVTDAGDVLTDSESRAAYDTFIDDQGTETGTELYEQWDAEGRPGSPTEWLAQPRSTDTATPTTDSTTTTADSTASTTADGTTTGADPGGDQSGWTQPEAGDDREGWSEDEWNTRGRTRDEQRTAGEPDATATGGADGTTADAATGASETADDSGRTTVHTGETATAEETTIPTGEAAAGEPVAGETTTTETSPNQATQSVLNRDPEEMYSEFVLDSDPEWEAASADDTAGGSGGHTGVAGGRGVAAVVPAPLARLLAVIVASPLGRILAVAAPRNRLVRGVVSVALVALAVAAGSALGAAGSALVLAPLVVFPRLGPWLFGALAAATAVVPATMPLAVPAAGWLALAGVAGGYYLLVWRSRLDPYASA